MKTQTRYKFLMNGMESAHGDMKWRLNKWYKHEGDIQLCKAGFHCSKGIYQAFSYIQGSVLALVEVRGEHKDEKDKEVWSEMRVVKRWKWQKRDSVLFSIYAARLCLKNFESAFPNDKRPREAIEAAERWVKNPTKENATYAYAASAYAAHTSAAAYAAAYAAHTSAAYVAAKYSLYKKLDKWMLNHLPELKEI